MPTVGDSALCSSGARTATIGRFIDLRAICRTAKDNPRVSMHFRALRALFSARAKANYIVFSRVRTLL